MSNLIFQQHGNCFVPMPGALTQHEQLPPGTYNMVYHESMAGKSLHLVATDDLGVPGKIYGNVEKRVKRLISTFKAREGVPTGALLSGLKGTGKTILAKRASEVLRTQHKIPTIIINEPFAGGDFLALIASIKQPCLVLFDEFEKVYGGEHGHERQNALLTLLDGTFSSHKLFMFIVNDNNLVDSLTNRPGRIHYRWSYGSLDMGTVVAYGRDTLKNQRHLDSLSLVCRMVTKLSFDILKALVWEMNQYEMDAVDALDGLNIDWMPMRSYEAQVTATDGEYKGRTWKLPHVSLDLTASSFSLSLAREEQNDFSLKQRAVLTETRNRLWDLMAAEDRIEGDTPEELLEAYDKKKIYLLFTKEHFISYDLDTDVYVFEQGPYMVRLQGSEDDMHTRSPRESMRRLAEHNQQLHSLPEKDLSKLSNPSSEGQPRFLSPVGGPFGSTMPPAGRSGILSVKSIDNVPDGWNNIPGDDKRPF